MLETEQSTDRLADGQVISNRYEIVKKLGAGGMGAVYLAQDRVLENAQVAIKILHSEFGKDNDLAKRFLREVALMNKVNHPNVVRTFDVGRDNSLIYFTMEFVQGTPLDNIARKSALDLNMVVQITQQVCAALQAIHAAEIVHRDLKPANIILLDDKTIKLTDFGVARSKGSNLTQHDEIIGSVEYMAPEVWLGKELSAATDFYSLGVILYELVTGKVPFESEQPATMMWLHVKRPPQPPKSLRPELPNWLNHLILKLLSKSPADRPKNAGEIIAHVASHMQRQGVAATGSFPVTSGTHPAAPRSSGTNTGSYPAVNTGSFPQVTHSVRRTSSRNSQRNKLRQHKRLVATGIALICAVVILQKHWMAMYMDLFPY